MTKTDQTTRDSTAGEAGSKKAKPQVRDADATRARIMSAAKREFARLGLSGARVDTIALKAKANKRMIYHYFGSKEDLFKAVIEQAYVEIRESETRLKLEHLEPRDALKKLVRFTWDYYLRNPEFITLVNSENLHRAKHIRQSELVQSYSRQFIAMVSDILERGVAAGVFRAGIDPVQLNITIAAISYYYLTNRYTGSIIFERDLMADQALKDRIDFNIETIMGLVCTADPPRG